MGNSRLICDLDESQYSIIKGILCSQIRSNIESNSPPPPPSVNLSGQRAVLVVNNERCVTGNFKTCTQLWQILIQTKMCPIKEKEMVSCSNSGQILQQALRIHRYRSLINIKHPGSSHVRQIDSQPSKAFPSTHFGLIKGQKVLH